MSLAALLGSSTDNSYLTVSEADGYAAMSPAELAWKTEADETKKEQALVTATGWMDTLVYIGSKCDAKQPLKWPRSGVVCGDYNYGCSDFPKEIERCTFVIANTLLSDPAYISGGIPGYGGEAGGGGTPGELVPGVPNSDLKRLKLDVMELEWRDDASGSSGSAGGIVVLEKFPQISQILGCMTESVASVGSSRVLLRVRS